MRWRKGRANLPPPAERPRDRHDEKGLREAHQALDAALSMWPDVKKVAEDIRGIRRRNHLAQKVLDAMGGHPR